MLKKNHFIGIILAEAIVSLVVLVGLGWIVVHFVRKFW